MCGIAGIWNHQGDRPAGVRIEAMLEAMRHRGPDGQDALSYHGGAAGMVRLALVDLSPRGQQPLWSACGRVAVIFNGEMYNFRDERQRLAQRGHAFRTTTDTEVVLALYLEAGLDFVHRLRGMYALAVFDWRETAAGQLPTLVLARDPLGIKPLYVAPIGPGDAVVFASELRGLLASGLVPPRIDPAAVADYFTLGHGLDFRAPIATVRMLAPGTIEVRRPGKPLDQRRFWQMPPYRPRRETLDEAAERLRALLEESVRLHAFADAPVGAFLSGGIDSTGIVALMRRHVADLRTYTLRFPDLPGGDEADDAVATARKYDCQVTVRDVSASDLAAVMPRFAADLDRPSIDGLNTWLISEAAARDVKGVLSGLGGDEWFAGYPHTRRMSRGVETWTGRAMARLGRLGSAVEPWLGDGRLGRRARALAARRSPLAMWLYSRAMFTPAQARRLAGLDPAIDTLPADLRAVVDQDFSGETPLGLSCLLDTRVYMGCQLLRDSDAKSMAHSLELRVPLVDVEIAAFSRSCADQYKLAPRSASQGQYASSGSKRVLIQALRDVLPDGIAARKKRGFTLPYWQWMHQALGNLVDETCRPETVAARSVIDPLEWFSVFAARRQGPPEALYPRIWAAMIFELWCRSVVDRRYDGRPARPVTYLAGGAERCPAPQGEGV